MQEVAFSKQSFCISLCILRFSSHWTERRIARCWKRRAVSSAMKSSLWMFWSRYVVDTGCPPSSLFLIWVASLVVGSEVLKVLSSKMALLYVAAPCRLAACIIRPHRPDNGSRRFFWNVGKLSDYTDLQPRNGKLHWLLITFIRKKLWCNWQHC